MKHPGGESKTCTQSPRWNDSTPTFAYNCTLTFWQHGQPRNRSKQSTLLVWANSVMLILMLSRRIPLPCQSYRASSKSFLAMFWRTFWNAPLVADSLCVLGRKIMMTIGVVTIRILQKLLKATWATRVCSWRCGGCQARDTWLFRAGSTEHHITMTLKWRVSANVNFVMLSHTRLAMLQFDFMAFQLGWLYPGVILLMQADALCSLVSRSRKVNFLLNSFERWNLSMHIISFANLLLSIMAIHWHVPCFTSSINKQGWMPRSKRSLHHKASPPLLPICSRSHCSRPRELNSSNTGLIATANMQFLTAWTVTMIIVSHYLFRMTSWIFFIFQCASSPSNGNSLQPLVVVVPETEMTSRVTRNVSIHGSAQSSRAC